MLQRETLLVPRYASPARPVRRGRRVTALRGGFSLLELVVVLTVIGVAAALAVPRMSGAAARYGVRAAAYRLASDLDSAAERARATGAAHTVVFRPSESGYAVMAGGPSNVQLPALWTVRLGEHPYQSQMQVQYSTTPERLGFDAFGRSTNDGVAAVVRGDYLVAVWSPVGSGVARVGSLQVVPAAGGRPLAIGNSIANAQPLGVMP